MEHDQVRFTITSAVTTTTYPAAADTACCSTKSATRTPFPPRARPEPARPTSARLGATALSLTSTGAGPSLERRAKRPRRALSGNPGQQVLEKLGRLDVVLPSAESRVYPCEELVQVCRQQTRGLSHGRVGALHDHGHEEHGVRQELDAERDDVEGHLGFRVHLGIGIGKGQTEGWEKDKCIEKDAGGGLRTGVSKYIQVDRVNGSQTTETGVGE